MTRKSPYAYIYRLDKAAMERIEKQESFEPWPELFRSPADSFMFGTNPPEMPAGNYLYVYASNRNLNTALVTITDMRAKMVGYKKDLEVVLYDAKTFTRIRQARVSVSGIAVPYDEASQTYKLNGFSGKKGRLRIETKDELLYLDLDAGKNRAREYGKPGYDGFIAFNKPKYLPGDTLKLKAYVTNAGVPLTEPLYLQVNEGTYIYSGDDLILRKKVNPVSPGSYLFEMVLGDTLDIDQEYYVSLQKKKYDGLVGAVFHLEDYQLDEAFYSIKPLKDSWYLGDTVKLELSAADANGLPLYDAEAVVNIRLDELVCPSDSIAYVPIDLPEVKAVMDAEGKYIVKLPPSLFPMTKVSYTAIAGFRNMNNELQHERCTFTIKQQEAFFELRDDTTSFTVRFMKNGRSTEASGEMRKIIESDVSDRKKISFPYTFYPDPFTQEYVFRNESAFLRHNIGSSMVKFEGERTADSLKVRILNPRKLEICYELHKDEKLLNKGCSATPVFMLRDTGKSVYEVHYRYLWKNANEAKFNHVLPRDKKLNVTLELPEKVYPGQQAKAQVKVTDFYGKPVKGANITMLSYNSQFRDADLPSPPDFHRMPDVKKGEYTRINTSSFKRKREKRLDSAWYARLRLDTLHYYRITNPGKGVYSKYFKIASDSAQFAPFVITDDRRFRSIAVIYINDVPVYFRPWKRSVLGGTEPYSFFAPEGRHSIRIRTENAEYTLEGVEMRKGYKLELSFHENGGSPVKKVARGKKFTRQEQQTLSRHLVFFDRLGVYNARISYAGATCNLYSNSCMLIDPRQGGSLNIEYTYYYPARKFRTQLPLKPNTVYTIRGEIKEQKALKKFPRPVKGLSHYETGEVRKDKSYFKPGGYRYYYEYYPEAGRLNHKGAGILSVRYTGGKELERAFIISEKKEVYHPARDADPSALHQRGLSPGLYSVVFVTKNGHLMRRDGIQVKPDQVTCVNIADPQVDTSPDVDIRRDDYSVSWSKGPAAIRGTVSDKGKGQRLSFARVTLIKGNSVERDVADSAGAFSFEKLEPGMYDLHFKSDSSAAELTVLGICVSENVSAEVNAKLPMVNIKKDKVHTFELVYKGGAMPLAVYDRKSETQPHFTLRWDKFTSRPVPSWDMNYVGTFATPFLADKPSITVNEESLYYSYSYKKRRRFRLFRSKSSFYRSKYSANRFRVSEKSRKIRTKFGDEAYDGASTYYYANPAYLNGNANAALFGVAGKLQSVEVSLKNLAGVQASRAYGWNYDKAGDGAVQFMPPVAEEELLRSSGMRSDFRDYAFWHPNLFTNEKGEVQADVKFPGNVTEWDSHTLVMDGLRSGKASAETKAYKEVMATLSLPRFLVQGDTAYIAGRSVNYLDNKVQVSTSFAVDGVKGPVRKQELDRSLNETFALNAKPGADSVKAAYSLAMDNGFVDGEEEEIPVYPQGVEEAKGIFLLLERDTTFTLAGENKEGTLELSALDNDLDVLLRQIKTVRDYPYFCNEQLASKLTGLIAEKNIRKKMVKLFTGDRDIARVLARLQANQLADGTWSWWPSGPSNFQVSLYVTSALVKADMAGYRSGTLPRAVAHFADNVASLKGDELVQVLELLSSIRTPLDYKALLKKAEGYTLSKYSEYCVLKIKQEQKLDYAASLKELLAAKKQTILGGCYWGEPANYSWNDNIARTSALVYRILQLEKDQGATLKGLRSYFLEPGNSEAFRNTLESATVLETILPGFLKDYKGTTSVPKLELKLKLKTKENALVSVDKYPFQGRSDASTDITVTKKGGGPVYFSAYRRSWNPAPKKDETLFAVNSTFLQDGKPVTAAEAGKALQMKVTVTAKKKGEYLMIEVPIPAGCSYDNKPQPFGSYEVHREYFKDKVAIFCENLPAGDHHFTISLEPRYAGSYHLNPVKASLMYFPVFSGTGEMTTTRVLQR